MCTCLPGYEPQPDTITGCSRIEARTPPPDPCYPSPCGPNTQCNVNGLGNPVCQCISGYVPAPDTITGCKIKPDPCNPNPCGPGADCVPTGDRATCRCPAGYKGDPFVSCRSNISKLFKIIGIMCSDVSGRENVSMITSVRSAWHVLTTTAETPVLAPVVRTPTARSEITDQSAAARRGSEVIL